MRKPCRRRRETGWAVSAAVLVAGCGPSVVRHPVPIGAEDRARLPGMADGVRAWGDAFSPALQKSLADSVPQCVAVYGPAYPTAGLAVSGGGSDGAFGAGVPCGWTAHGDRSTFRLAAGTVICRRRSGRSRSRPA